MKATEKRNSFTWFPRFPEAAPASRKHIRQVAEERLLPAGSAQPARPVLARQHTHFLPGLVTGWTVRALSGSSPAPSLPPSPLPSPALASLRKAAFGNAVEAGRSSPGSARSPAVTPPPSPPARAGVSPHEWLWEED